MPNEIMISDLYGVVGSDGTVSDFSVDGKPCGFVQAKKNKVTGGSEISAGGKELGAALNRTISGLGKNWGLTSVSANSALPHTRLTKLVADAPYQAVRVHHYHMGTTLPQWKFAVAATETADTSTQKNLAHPVVGGAAYNTIDSVSDAYGWQTAKFAGASSVTCAGTGSADSAEILSSDWTPLMSVARADAGETLPLAMVMGIALNSATQGHSWMNATGAAAMRTRTAANRGRIIQMSRNGIDAIAAPGTGTFTLQVDGMSTWLEFAYIGKSASVMFIGDSTVQNQAIVADNFTSWGMRVCADLSTTQYPVIPINQGASNRNSIIYWTEGKRMIALHKPKVAVFQCHSHNDGGYTTDGDYRYKLQAIFGRVVDFIQTCRQYGVSPILDTGIPAYTQMNASREAIRIDYFNRIRALASAAGCGLIDSDALFTDGGAIANIKAALNFGDNIHPNEAGIEAKAIYANAIIKPYI